MSFTEHNVNGVIFDTAGTLSVGGVRHAFTTRHGGVSPAPFDSLNLASNRGDREENILENYRRLGAAVGFDASRAVGCRQIHSDLVRVAREEDAGKIRWDERPYDADALITNVPNLPLFAYGTDCCMITVYDPTSRSIAAIHAGWRGTASGIVLKALVTMMSLYGADPYTMRAAIGPGLFADVGVSGMHKMLPGDVIPVRRSPCTLALDGEREVEVRKGQRAGVRLSDDWLRVVDVQRTLEYARQRGLFMRGAQVCYSR